MKYIADGLTLLRMFVAAAIIPLGLLGLWEVALGLFITGILTDAFDGPAARKWPYSKHENATLWWRKDAHKFDNMADVLLSGAGLVSLSFSQLNWWQAVLIVAGVGLLSFIIQMIVDNIGPRSPRVAERIDVAHGWLFGFELTTMLALMTLLASQLCLFAVYAVLAVPLLWFKWDRVTSRAELTYGAS